MFVQRIAASPSSCVTGLPQDGHTDGNSNGTAFSACSLTERTSGIISPAFLIITVSPTQIPFSSIKSLLWSVARLTVVPARSTGSKLPTGVSTPVLPTLISILRSLVGFSSGGYLYASAHLGYFAVLPRSRRLAKLSTLTTAPSIA